MIDEKIIDDLRIETTDQIIEMHVVENISTKKRPIASFSISSTDGTFQSKMENAIVGKIHSAPGEVAPGWREWSYPHFNNIAFEKINSDLGMIIGAAHVHVWMPARGVRVGRKSEPIAIETPFGWTVLGGGGGGGASRVTSNALAASNAEISSNLQKIFYHDFPIVSEEELGESRENRDAIKQLAESIHFNKEVGKYFVALPWKTSREDATKTLNALNSRGMAMRRLKGMIPRFQRDGERKERIFKEMEKFVETGVAVQIEPTNDDTTATTPRWYLPIHVVEKRGKTRPCHDARASVAGICLNEMLLGGPNIMNSLSEVLLNFRAHKVAFMTDIKGFFHQIRVDPRDVDVFRYLWFADAKMEKAVMMRFLSHVFGSGASSIVTSYVLRHHAHVIKDRYPPNVFEMIFSNFYVDDGSGGASSVEEALLLKENLIKAMDEGGFPLAKWKSNHPALTDGEAQPEVKLRDRNEEIEEEQKTKVLGVAWRPTTDVLASDYDEEIANCCVNTPREVVAIQAKIYDPFGNWVPLTVDGRHFMQLCKAGERGWDSPLDPDLKRKFEK